MYNCLIGIDGGGTKTNVKVLNENEEVIFYDTYGPSNVHAIGKDAFNNLVRDILSELGILGICMNTAALTFGGAGLDTKETIDYVKDVFREYGFNGHLNCINDAEIALVAGNGALCGGVLICGTGSIAMGMSKEGLIRVGGWGHLLGDEGSGYKIATDTFSMIFKSLDGRVDEEADALTLLKVLGFKNLDGLLEFVYTTCENKSQIASYTKDLLDHYETSTIVKKVLDYNLEENLSTICAMVKRMESNDFELSLAGGLFENSNLYYKLMEKRINEAFPKLLVRRPLYSAVDGALLLSKKERNYI